MCSQLPPQDSPMVQWMQALDMITVFHMHIVSCKHMHTVEFEYSSYRNIISSKQPQQILH